jgi:hypothetical protein
MILNRASALPTRTGDILESGLYFDAGHGGRLGWDQGIADPVATFLPVAGVKKTNMERIV